MEEWRVHKYGESAVKRNMDHNIIDKIGVGIFPEIKRNISNH